MKGIGLVAALQLMVVPPVTGQPPGVDTLFPAAPTGHVTDVSGVLSAGDRTALETLAARIRRVTGAEIAIAVLPTIGDRAAVDVAVAIGRRWGVGAEAEIGDARRNAGLVILLVPRRAGDPQSGQIFLGTGQGLEGIVTDAAAGRVRDLMRPALSREAYGEGLRIGLEALAALITRGMGVSDSVLASGDSLLRERSAAPGRTKVVGLVALMILVLLIAAGSTGRRGGPRGPGIRRRHGRTRMPPIWIGGLGGGGFGGGLGGGGFGGGGFGGFGGGGGFSGGGAGGRF